MCEKDEEVLQAPVPPQESETPSSTSRMERGEEAFRKLARALGRATCDANPGVLKSQ